MRHDWKMLLAALVCLLCLVLAGTAVADGDTEYATEIRSTTDSVLMSGEEKSYTGTPVTGASGEVTADDVRFYTTASTESDVIRYLAEGTLVELLTIPDQISVDHWYQVRYDGKTGYIQSNFIRVLNAGESASPEVDSDVIARGETYNTSGVNFRKGPSKSYTSMGKLTAGIAVDILEIPAGVSSEYWYKVRYNGDEGYIQAPYIRLLEIFEEETPSDPDDEEEEDSSGSGEEEDPLPVIATGVTTATSGVNFRKGPGTGYGTWGKLASGLIVDILEIPEKIDSSHWFHIRYEGNEGYIQSPYISVLDVEKPEELLPSTGEVTATGGVRFRTGPGKEYGSMGSLSYGAVVELLSIPEKVDEDHWYKVKYNGKTGYIQSIFIRVLHLNMGDLPVPETYGYARLQQDSVYLRKTAGGANAVQWKGRGSLLRITGPSETNGNYQWYPVYYSAEGAIYYVRGDMIEVVQVENGEVTTPTPEAESAFGYVITTTSGAALHLLPEEETVTTVPKNTILACLAPAEKPDNSQYWWYKVRHNGMTGYLRGDTVRVCTSTGGELEEEENTPAPGGSGETVDYGYIKTNTGNNVHMRATPGGTVLVTLPHGTIVTVTGPHTAYGEYGKYIWYPVKLADGQKGYIRGDCVMVCDANGNPPASDPTPTPSPETELLGVTGRILKGANFRSSASASNDDNIITVIPVDTVVTVLTIPEDKENGWYKIFHDGQKGYVIGYLLEVLSDEGEEEPTPAPTSGGYIIITGTSVAVRKTPGGTSQTRVATDTVWPIIGESVTVSGVNWFHVKAGGKEGYVHGDYAVKLTPEQEESYLAGNGVPEITPNPELVDSKYLITVKTEKLNIRESYTQDSARVGQVGSGVVLEFIGTKQVGTVQWYNVIYNHVECWVHGDYVDVMTLAEFYSWLEKHPDFLPVKEENLGFVRTTKSNVYIRNAASGSVYIDQIKKENTVLRYYVEGIPAGGYTWYRVMTPAGELGYVRSDLVKKCQEDGSAMPTPTPNIGNLQNAPQSEQETSYTTLRLGDGGSSNETKALKVANLVQELINQGYYMGELTNSYTSDVEAAVELFQSVKGLEVDGIAGSATQHALFGTRPIGSGDTDNLDFTIYPVEKIDWYTGGIQDMIPRGANFKVYDVKTRIVWWAHRWAGSRHADIETLTAADSARLCEIYGVNSLPEIEANDMWERRPCLITIGTRTFAASLDGVVHNPDGDTIPNNNMNGQICMHFTNSEGHESQAVSPTHAKAIEYAYNNCPAGQKK